MGYPEAKFEKGRIAARIEDFYTYFDAEKEKDKLFQALMAESKSSGTEAHSNDEDLSQSRKRKRGDSSDSIFSEADTNDINPHLLKYDDYDYDYTDENKSLRHQTRQERKQLAEQAVSQVQNRSRQKSRYGSSYSLVYNDSKGTSSSNLGSSSLQKQNIASLDSKNKQRANVCSDASNVSQSQLQVSPHIGTKIDGIVAPIVLENSADLQVKMAKQVQQDEMR